jgi:hypothetical protein
MQRSASASGSASGGSCASPSGGSASTSELVGSYAAGSGSEEDLRMALARKVACEVAAGSAVIERNRH